MTILVLILAALAVFALGLFLGAVLNAWAALSQFAKIEATRPHHQRSYSAGHDQEVYELRKMAGLGD